jgi:hypothetical protein
MNIETNYHKDWQNNRMNFILSMYPKEFFKDKKILELGSYNGYFGECFRKMGAYVLSIEGRPENVTSIKNNFPELLIECRDLDTNTWEWGEWDIIINFGLIYHLEKHHKEHLENCINNCNLLFLESVIYDSNQSEIFFKNESGGDQSLSDVGGTPSTSYVEDILNNLNSKFTKYTTSNLNGIYHHYDWVDTGLKNYDGWARRFWVVENNQK